MFMLEAGTDEYRASTNSLGITLTTDRFNLHRDAYLCRELSENVGLYYEKIVTLLEQLSVDEKGDN